MLRTGSGCSNIATRRFTPGSKSCWPRPSSSNRQAVIDEYRAALATPGNAARGKAVFKKSCSVCHRLEEVGTAVGPDLAALTDKSNAAHAGGDSRSQLRGGKQIRQLHGRHVGRADVYRHACGGNRREHHARRTGRETDDDPATDLEELASSGRSLMPEGLEKDIGPTDFTDLIAYLSATRPPRRMFDW